uniref:Methyltransferase-like 26 n=1 Tax=Malurus cyaneus samueli TaxID=2593467 RepID=A0A8C5X997_9PASS
MQVPAAAERNKGPILACAGAGSNAAHFARALPQTRWQPSDNRPGACAGDIAAYVEAAGLPNLLPPIPLDVSQGWESWGGTQPATLDLLVSINMMHIAELRCTEGLFRGAGVLLKPGGVLFTYGVGHLSSAGDGRDARAWRACRCRDPGKRQWAVRDWQQACLGPAPEDEGWSCQTLDGTGDTRVQRTDRMIAGALERLWYRSHL